MKKNNNSVDNALPRNSAEIKTARVVRFAKTGGPEVLRIESLEVLPLRDDEVRIKVSAIGLNRAEAMWRSGNYIEEPVLPAKLGYDAAGIVQAVGKNVTGLAVGDKVGTIPAFSQNDYGVYGDLITVPRNAVIKSPDDLSFIEVAAIWNPFITSWSALIDIAELKSGQVVLITAASSSVGLAAIQVVNLAGGISVALTRNSDKKEQLLNAGAAFVIATSEQDVVEEVQKITSNNGADVVFDSVGGILFSSLLKSLARGGQIFLYGALSDDVTALPLLEVLNKVPVIRGHTVWDTTKDPVRVEKARQYIFKGIAAGALKPVVTKTFPFEDIVEAHRFLESNQQVGKIVVTV
ncbi:zinc-dependent alcohol dehydrogenase family protein [Mucilaginibacter rigui]|uniref:Zinc-dependent alcohol dehydrogenase family protein n=1 Tax=Mucilaginibacter rigui TaxID=534635 RepID=A0ABR7X5U8_9SPHI|nr:zinc-dependent alcohol dehydrogenase family protein [Mucilaginibacter rigui]MBD1385930.1 zinc-dependent alcohol dehydrogenase family protein [Mucilaginibacter rigui]